MAMLLRFILIVLSLKTAPLMAAENHYMIVFAVQDAINRMTTAHTFAVFVQAEQGESENKITETAVISWLPQSGQVCIICPAEEGRNYTFSESLDEPTADGLQISKWGPYKVKKELFARAVRQQARLDQRKILFKAYDEQFRFKGLASNCEHAVSDIDTDRGYLHTGAAHGNRGSRMVARHLSRWITDDGRRHEWVSKALGLEHYDIITRSLR